MTSNLQVKPAESSSARQNAIEEATKAQRLVTERCANDGREPPPYILSELIGKGSFGRVYTAFTDKAVKKLVAVKIISIEEGDSSCPGASDTFQDILHEVKTLKLLNERGAKNINIIIDTLLVGPSIWVVTEYCAGGSVATLLRPTKGLAEKWIVPILRDVAVALHWVHKHDVIHRDVKCANILITESGQVQLCDFGVAGIIESRFDKRSTVTGTLQWMAPELFDSSVSYGTEVDIWALGSTAFEMAMGAPPNAVPIVDLAHFGSYLKHNAPRLEGDQYSADLKDLVSRCMVQEPAQRPSIEKLQRHPYIAGTEASFPTVTLTKLVEGYRLWESMGGSRLSLFSKGGAQADSESFYPSSTQDWTFDTMDSSTFESSSVEHDSNAQAINDVYGSRTDILQQPAASRAPRRRQPPSNMKTLTVPLEQVFDPNTISNYDDNARVFYSRQMLPTSSDLPLRDESRAADVRESLIDLDAALEANHVLQLPDQDTIRPISTGPTGQDRPPTQEWRFPATEPASGLDTDTIRPVSTGPTGHERPPTQEWRFPMAGPAFARSGSTLTSVQVDSDEESDEARLTMDDANRQDRLRAHKWKFPMMACSLRNPSMTRESQSVNSWTQPNVEETGFTDHTNDLDASHRTSALSLIDLDAGLAVGEPYGPRPSTADSETTSAPSAMGDSAFYLERHLSDQGFESRYRGPSIFVPDGIGIQAMPPNPDFDDNLPSSEMVNDVATVQRPPIQAPGKAIATQIFEERRVAAQFPDYERTSEGFESIHNIPEIPKPPSVSALLGNSSPAELKAELQRVIASLSEHLDFTSDSVSALPVRWVV